MTRGSRQLEKGRRDPMFKSEKDEKQWSRESCLCRCVSANEGILRLMMQCFDFRDHQKLASMKALWNTTQSVQHIAAGLVLAPLGKDP